MLAVKAQRHSARKSISPRVFTAFHCRRFEKREKNRQAHFLVVFVVLENAWAQGCQKWAIQEAKRPKIIKNAQSKGKLQNMQKMQKNSKICENCIFYANASFGQPYKLLQWPFIFVFSALQAGLKEI